VFALGLQHIKDPGQRLASRGRRSWYPTNSLMADSPRDTHI